MKPRAAYNQLDGSNAALVADIEKELAL